MSTTSWKEEFYPVPAKDVPVEKATAHSLQKWNGLRKENLGRHDLTAPPIAVDSGTCALCLHHECSACPLALSRDGTPCAEYDALRDPAYSPWEAWVGDGDPEPMIEALECAQ